MEPGYKAIYVGLSKCGRSSTGTVCKIIYIGLRKCTVWDPYIKLFNLEFCIEILKNWLKVSLCVLTK